MRILKPLAPSRPAPGIAVAACVSVLALLLTPACWSDDESPSDDDASEPAGSSPTPAATPTPTAEERNQRSSAGDFALEFLRSSPYPRLLIEIDVVDGATPDSDAIDTLVETLESLCDKPDGIEVLFPDDTLTASSTDNPELSLAAIKALEDANRDHYAGGDTAVLYFLYVDGHSDYDTEDAQVVGYAYRGSSMAVFMGTVEKQSILLQSLLTEIVTVHELGHELGLVDNGVPMAEPHKDPDHGPHCDNDQCMMYWTNSSTDVLDIVTGDLPDFDDACMADLAAARGRPI